MPDFDPQSAIDAAAAKYQVDPDLATAIAQQGEGFGKFLSNDAVSPKGARGVMQLMPDTAAALDPKADINDPYQNVDLGVRNIRQLQDQFGADHPDLIAAAYNAGPKAIQNGQIPSFPETQAYVKRVTGALKPQQTDLDAAFGIGKTPAAAGSGVTVESVSDVSPEDLNAAFGIKPAVQGPQNQPAPVTAQGLGKAFGTGALNTVMNAANVVANPAAVMGGGFDVGGPLAAFAADKMGLISPQQRQALNAQQAGFRSAFLGPTTTEQQSALGLYHAPQNAAERLAMSLGAAAPAAPVAPLQAATGAFGQFAGSEAARRMGFGPEVQSALGMVGGLGGGALGEGGVRAFSAGKQAAANALNPFAAAFNRGAAETQAGAALQRGATNPTAVRASLAEPGELVLGSQPTTFQQTGDMGLGAMERGVRGKNPELFKALEAEQNKQRVEALQGIQQGGNAGELSAGISQAQEEADAAEGQLWKSVDPDKSITGSVVTTKLASQDIQGGIAQSAKQPSGEEAAIYDAADKLPAVAPLSELLALRSRVSTAMREEFRASGKSATYARLTQLRGAIQDNLENTINDKVAADDQSVQTGQLPAPQSARAKLEQALADARSQGLSVSFGRTALSGGAGPAGPIGATDISGTALPPGGESGGPAGNPPGAGGPTFDQAAASRLAAATAATKENARVFGNPVVQKVLGVTDPADVTKTIGTILRGRTAVQDMGAIAEAAAKSSGGMDGLRQAVADHISNTLLSNTEAGTSGVPVIKADQFQTFVRTNRPALSKVFSDQELDTLDSIAADIQRAKRSDTALKLAGSNTLQDLAASGIMPQAVSRGLRGATDLMGMILGGALGEHAGPLGEAVGGAAGAVVSEGVQALRNAGINRVSDLVTQAMLKPEVARQLLAKVPDTPAARQTAILSLARAIAGGAPNIVRPEAKQQRPTPIRLSALGGRLSPATNAFSGVLA